MGGGRKGGRQWTREGGEDGGWGKRREGGRRMERAYPSNLVKEIKRPTGAGNLIRIIGR